MSLFFSTAIILDLFFLLKNPFSSTEARVKKLTIIAVMLSVLFAAFCTQLTLSKVDSLAKMNLVLFIFVAAFNIVFGIVTLTFVFVRFRTKGMSEEIKKQIQKRYLEFIVVYSLLEGPFIFYAKPQFQYSPNNLVFVASTLFIESWYGFSVTLFGLFIALSRMRDKIVRTKVSNIWYQLTCRRYKMVKFDKFDELVKQSQMNTFLKTSLNTELVITILKGILILAASSSDKIDHMDDADMYKIKQTTTIELEKIKIKDASQFTINEQGRASVYKSSERGQ